MIRKLAENVFMLGNQYFNYLLVGEKKAAHRMWAVQG